MGIYLRQHMGDEALYKLIWEDAGGDSAEFLKHILVQDPEPITKALDSSGVGWHAALEQYGALLVSGAYIEENFLNGNLTSFLGESSSKKLGRHAMVLVGHRREGDQDLFLLQNWWKHKPFVEVTAGYLESCSAIIRAVKTKQTKMGNYATGNAAHVEADYLDAGEHLTPEW